MRIRGLTCSLALASFIAVPSLAFAQPAAPTQFVEQETERASSDETLLALSAGGTLNTGNTRSMTLNLGASFSLKRARHQLSAGAGVTFGRAALRDMTGAFGSYTSNAETFTGRLRYDFFITEDDALFAVVKATRDRFAGLDSRLQAQVGYMRNIFLENRTEEQGGGTHRLWAEIGYDFTHDNYDPDPLLGPMMVVLPGDASIHSARAYVGYTNTFNAAVSLTTGAELLVDLQDPENTRLEWITSLTSSVSEALKLKLDFTMRYDNQPVPGKDRLDTSTVLNLVFSLDLAPPPPPPPEPAADEPADDASADDAAAAPADDAPADAPPADAPPADAPADAPAP